MSSIRTCSSRGFLVAGNGNACLVVVLHAPRAWGVGVGSSQNRVSQVFLSYRVPRGIFNIFHKDTWITKKISYIVFLLKNLLVAVLHSSENTDHIALCHCLVGTGFPRHRLTCAHPKSQTDLGMSLWTLGWCHQGHVRWEPLELPGREVVWRGRARGDPKPTREGRGRCDAGQCLFHKLLMAQPIQTHACVLERGSGN